MKVKTMPSKPMGKNVMTEEIPKQRITRAKNKYRLNLKSILKPSFRKTTVISIDSDSPPIPAKKKRVKIGIPEIDPLFQLAEAVEAIEKVEEKVERGMEATVTVKQWKGKR